MKILALEPYYDGSHRHFIDNWIARSRHDWTLLTLPARWWKWRMRHAAVSFSQELREQHSASRWDLIFCSDMLNLPEFLGLIPASIASLPRVIYFHENQWTYPVRKEEERDHHFGCTNMLSALAATEVWFNSLYHQGEMLQGCHDFLRRMPDNKLPGIVQELRKKSRIEYPGVELSDETCQASSRGETMHIVWAARWEHDKGPDNFFKALTILLEHDFPFQVSVLGQSFREQPNVFSTARELLGERVLNWGYQPSRAAYESILSSADVIVSTAQHEFFGISVVEAIAAGAFPLLPRRLAYPEVLQFDADARRADCFYDGTATGLADSIMGLRRSNMDALQADLAQAMQRFRWEQRAKSMDDRLENVIAIGRAN